MHLLTLILFITGSISPMLADFFRKKEENINVIKCKIAFNNYDINCAKSGGGCLQSQINCQSLLRGASIILPRLLKSSLKCA